MASSVVYEGSPLDEYLKEAGIEEEVAPPVELEDLRKDGLPPGAYEDLDGDEADEGGKGWMMRLLKGLPGEILSLLLPSTPSHPAEEPYKYVLCSSPLLDASLSRSTELDSDSHQLSPADDALSSSARYRRSSSISSPCQPRPLYLFGWLIWTTALLAILTLVLLLLSGRYPRLGIGLATSTAGVIGVWMTQKGSRRTRAGNRERREGEGFGQPQREAIALMKQLVVEAEAFDRAVNTALQTVILKDDEEKLSASSDLASLPHLPLRQFLSSTLSNLTILAFNTSSNLHPLLSLFELKLLSDMYTVNTSYATSSSCVDPLSPNVLASFPDSHTSHLHLKPLESEKLSRASKRISAPPDLRTFGLTPSSPNVPHRHSSSGLRPSTSFTSLPPRTPRNLKRQTWSMNTDSSPANSFALYNASSSRLQLPPSPNISYSSDSSDVDHPSLRPSLFPKSADSNTLSSETESPFARRRRTHSSTPIFRPPPPPSPFASLAAPVTPESSHIRPRCSLQDISEASSHVSIPSEDLPPPIPESPLTKTKDDPIRTFPATPPSVHSASRQNRRLTLPSQFLKPGMVQQESSEDADEESEASPSRIASFSHHDGSSSGNQPISRVSSHPISASYSNLPNRSHPYPSPHSPSYSRRFSARLPTSIQSQPPHHPHPRRIFHQANSSISSAPPLPLFHSPPPSFLNPSELSTEPSPLSHSHLLCTFLTLHSRRRQALVSLLALRNRETSESYWGDVKEQVKGLMEGFREGREGIREEVREVVKNFQEIKGKEWKLRPEGEEDGEGTIGDWAPRGTRTVREEREEFVREMREGVRRLEEKLNREEEAADAALDGGGQREERRWEGFWEGLREDLSRIVRVYERAKGDLRLGDSGQTTKGLRAAGNDDLLLGPAPTNDDLSSSLLPLTMTLDVDSRDEADVDRTDDVTLHLLSQSILPPPGRETLFSADTTPSLPVRSGGGRSVLSREERIAKAKAEREEAGKKGGKGTGMEGMGDVVIELRGLMGELRRIKGAVGVREEEEEEEEKEEEEEEEEQTPSSSTAARQRRLPSNTVHRGGPPSSSTSSTPPPPLDTTLPTFSALSRPPLSNPTDNKRSSLPALSSSVSSDGTLSDEEEVEGGWNRAGRIGGDDDGGELVFECEQGSGSDLTLNAFVDERRERVRREGELDGGQAGQVA